MMDGFRPAGQHSALLALDVGTSGCKGAIYQPDGQLLAEASAGYTVQRPAPWYVEQQPDDWWNAAAQVCHQLLEQAPVSAVAGIGLCGQVPTMLLVDEAGRALGPAITWQDRRAEAEAVWLREQVGAEHLRAWLGLDLPVDAGWPPARLLWWQRHQPASIRRARHVLMAKDYLLLRLTGVFASDAWSAKGLIHLLTGAAPPAYYARLGLPSTLAPPIRAPYTVAGAVTPEAAAVTGLRAGTPVVTGWSDALCGMAGAGAFQTAGVAFNLTGTSEIVGCSGAQPTAGLLFIPGEISGGTAVGYGPTQSGGDSLAWFGEWTGAGFDAAAAAAESVRAGESEVVFLPYLQGERAPLWDTAARGAFFGLLRQHTLGHGSRAVMEGVVMSVRHILETCGVMPGSDTVVRAAGGGTRLKVWNQIRADVLGLTVEIVEQSSATTLGAAMLAAVGAGLYPDLSAASAMIRIERACTPDAALAAHYNRLYRQFRAAYPLMKAMFAADEG